MFTVDVYDMCGYIGTRGDVEWSAPTIAKEDDGSWHLAGGKQKLGYRV